MTPAALTRVLGEDELTLGARRLASDLNSRIGHSVSLSDLTLPISPGYEVALGALSATLGPLQLAVTDNAGLSVSLELAIAPQPLSGVPAPCEASASLAAGTLTATFDLSNDKLGRPLPIPRGTPRWDGPPPTLELAGCALADLQVPDFGQRLLQSAWSTLQEPLVQALPAALGLDLSLSTSSVVGLDALGAGILRASLRVASSPTATDAGLAIAFDLGLDAEAHPCASFPISAAEPRDPLPPPGPPPTAGTALSFVAAEQLLRLAWVAGSVCGASAWRSIPEDLRELPLADLDLPGASELSSLDAAATASASFWPRELPTLSAHDTLPDTIRIVVPRLEADVTAVIDGARWRLFTLELDLAIGGQLAVDADGFVHFDPIDVETAILASRRGLIAAPPLGSAGVIEPIVRALLDSRPLFRLPPSLTPSRTVVWGVSPEHLTLSSPQ